MKFPAVQGLIERRILVNYRVDAHAIRRVVPPPHRPPLVAGNAIAGICLIRLSGARPRGVPSFLGVRSENAAHRIAVEWDDASGHHVGVYIPRRDTSSRFNTLVGGRFFPGEHHPADFHVRESDGRYEVDMLSRDGGVRVMIRARIADALPAGSMFTSLAAASAFFRQGSLGYSATSDRTRFDGLELECRDWAVRPLHVEAVRSSFFENTELFRPGDVAFDNALLMTNVRHRWLGRPSLCCDNAGAAQAEPTIATTFASK